MFVVQEPDTLHATAINAIKSTKFMMQNDLESNSSSKCCIYVEKFVVSFSFSLLKQVKEWKEPFYDINLINLCKVTFTSLAHIKSKTKLWTFAGLKRTTEQIYWKRMRAKFNADNKRSSSQQEIWITFGIITANLQYFFLESLAASSDYDFLPDWSRF